MRIYTKAIDNAGPYPIFVKEACRRVLVQENFNSANPPTADLNQFDEHDSAGAFGCRIAKGTPAVFADGRTYSPQDPLPAGYINTASGSITVLVIEHEKI